MDYMKPSGLPGSHSEVIRTTSGSHVAVGHFCIALQNHVSTPTYSFDLGSNFLSVPGIT